MKLNIWTFAIFLCFMFPQLVNGQEQHNSTPQKDYRYGARLGTYLTSYQSEEIYFTYFTFGFGKHEFALGPSIGQNASFPLAFFPYEDQEKINLRGLDFSYKIKPNGIHKLIDFYFQFDIFQTWMADNGVRWTSGIEYVPLTMKVQTTQLLARFGFELKFLNYFSVGPSLGFGTRFRRIVLDYPDQLPQFDSEWDPEIVLGLNLGVTF